MKGLQGERLRQAFKYFDQDEDGFIRPDQFKRIVLVSWTDLWRKQGLTAFSLGTCWPQTLRSRHREAPYTMHPVPWRANLLLRSQRVP